MTWLWRSDIMAPHCPPKEWRLIPSGKDDTMSEEMNRDMQHGSREHQYRRLRGGAVWKITGWIVLVLGTLLIVSRALTVSYLVFAKGYWG